MRTPAIVIPLVLSFIAFAPLRGQIPPLPETFKPIHLGNKVWEYGGRPEKITPENYQAYRNRTLDYLTNNQAGFRNSRIRLDLLMAAVEAGAQSDIEQFRADLILNHPNSLEADFIVSAVKKEQLDNDLSRQFKEIGENLTLPLLAKFYYAEERISKELESSSVGNDANMIKFISSLFLNYIGNKDKIKPAKPSESKIEEKYIEDFAQNKKSELDIGLEKLFLYMSRDDNNLVDFLLHFSHTITSSGIKRAALKYLYINHLSESGRSRYAIALCMANTYMKEGNFDAAELLLRKIVDDKRSIMPRYLLALCLATQGKSKESQLEFTRLHHDSPKHKKTILGLMAYTASHKDSISKTISLFDDVLDRFDIEKFRNVSLAAKSVSGKEELEGTFWVDFGSSKGLLTVRPPQGPATFVAMDNEEFHLVKAGAKEAYHYSMSGIKFSHLSFGPTSETKPKDFMCSFAFADTFEFTLLGAIRDFIKNHYMLDKQRRRAVIEACCKLGYFVTFANHGKDRIVTWINPNYDSITYIKMEYIIDQNNVLKKIIITDPDADSGDNVITIEIAANVPVADLPTPPKAAMVKKVDHFGAIELLADEASKLLKDYWKK